MKHLKGCIPYQKSGRPSNNEPTSSSNHQSVIELLNSKESDSNQVMSRDRLKERVLRIIVSGNLPLSFADNIELRALLKDTYPDYSPHNWKSAHEYLQSRSDATVADIKAKLVANEFKVNLVLDAWTTRSNLSFLGTFPFSVAGYHCVLLIISLHPVIWCNVFPYIMLVTYPFPVTSYTGPTALIIRCYCLLDRQ